MNTSSSAKRQIEPNCEESNREQTKEKKKQNKTKKNQKTTSKNHYDRKLYCFNIAVLFSSSHLKMRE